MKRSEKAPDTGARREFRVFLYFVLLALAVTLIVEAFNHKAFTDGPASLLRYLTRSPMAFLTNAAILLTALAPAMFLRRRVFWCGVVSILWLAGGAANGFILINRMTPFTVADLTVFNTGLDTLPNYLSKPYLILLGAGVALAAVGLGVLFWKGPRNRRSGRRRLLAGLAAEGETILQDPSGHIARGYENLPEMLCRLVADVEVTDMPDISMHG